MPLRGYGHAIRGVLFSTAGLLERDLLPYGKRTIGQFTFITFMAMMFAVCALDKLLTALKSLLLITLTRHNGESLRQTARATLALCSGDPFAAPARAAL